MIVIQQRPLTAGEKELVDALYRQAEKCNLAMKPATIDGTPSRPRTGTNFSSTTRFAQLPWVIVRYPDHVVADGPAYSGPLQAEALRNLLESPARTELARRLLQGESAVWLLLESGDAKKDDDVEAKLRTWLGRIGKDLEAARAEQFSQGQATA